MTTGDDTSEPVKPKSEQALANKFVQSYQALCDETGYRLVVSPVWIARDDGTFSLQLQYQVGKLPQGKNFTII